MVHIFGSQYVHIRLLHILKCRPRLVTSDKNAKTEPSTEDAGRFVVVLALVDDELAIQHDPQCPPPIELHGWSKFKQWVWAFQFKLVGQTPNLCWDVTPPTSRVVQQRMDVDLLI